MLMQEIKSRLVILLIINQINKKVKNQQGPDLEIFSESGFVGLRPNEKYVKNTLCKALCINNK